MAPRGKPAWLAALALLSGACCLGMIVMGGALGWLAGQSGLIPGTSTSSPAQGQPPARPAAGPPVRSTLPRPASRNAATPGATLAAPPLSVPKASPGASPLPAVQPIQPASQPPGSASVRPPERPATRLVIPAMQLDVPVVVSPILSRSWQVDALGAERVGHLEGTASPGEPGNVVLAGHVTTAPNRSGPFAGLGRLRAGDRITVYVGERAYAYQVDYQRLVERNDIQVTYPSSTGRITLITCSDWSEALGGYQKRLIVVGHLVEQ